jgi:hypothetical protein
MGPRKSGADSVGLKGRREGESLRFIGDGLHDVAFVAKNIGRDDGSHHLALGGRGLVLFALALLHDSDECIE